MERDGKTRAKSRAFLKKHVEAESQKVGIEGFNVTMSLLPTKFEKTEANDERNTQRILREMHETNSIAANTLTALHEDDGISKFISACF